MLDSRRYEVFVGRFARTLRARHESRSGPAAQPARTVAPDLIEDRFRLFLKAAAQIRPESQAWEYHRLRARGKRARYTIEFLADLYPGREAPVLKALVAVQDILGLHQDADVAIDRLRSLASLERDLGPQTIFAMGEVAERYRRTMIELRSRFPKAYGKASGPRWKAFRKAIDASRRDPVSRAASPTGQVILPGG
jgi:CHAD domain-containing protein